MQTATGRIVFEGTSSWWETVNRNEEIVAGPPWTDDWKLAAAAAGVETHNTTSWVARIEHVAERHSAIQVGDYACRERPNKPVVFVRIDATATS